MTELRTAGGPNLREDMWYRLSNSEPDHALDVVNTVNDSNGKIELRRTGHYSGQFWRVQSVGNGLYALHTQYLGAHKLLDVYGDDPWTPHLADRGNYSGQRWHLDWRADTDTFALSNTYGGLYLRLDTRQSQQVVMAKGDESSGTQRWRFTPIGSITRMRPEASAAAPSQANQG